MRGKVKKPEDRLPLKGQPKAVVGPRGGRKLLNKKQPSFEEQPPEVDLRGRPTKYRPEMDEQAYGLALLGYTQNEMARFFNVSRETFDRWVEAFSSFRTRLREGQEPADIHVARSLYQQATGYEVTVEELKVVNSGNFKQEVVTQKVKRFIAPDYRATSYWMAKRNRMLNARGGGPANDPVNWDNTPDKEGVGGGGTTADIARAAREAIAAADAVLPGDEE